MKYIKKFNESIKDIYIDDDIQKWSKENRKLFLKNLDDIIPYVNAHGDYYFMFQQDYKSEHLDLDDSNPASLDPLKLSNYFNEYEINLIYNFNKIYKKFDDFQEKIYEQFDESVTIELNTDVEMSDNLLEFCISVSSIKSASDFKLLFDEITIFESILESKLRVNLEQNFIYLTIIKLHSQHGRL